MGLIKKGKPICMILRRAANDGRFGRKRYRKKRSVRVPLWQRRFDDSFIRLPSVQCWYVMDVHECESRECNAIFRQFSQFYNLEYNNKKLDLDNDRKRKSNTLNFPCSPGIKRIRDGRRFRRLFFFFAQIFSNSEYAMCKYAYRHTHASFPFYTVRSCIHHKSENLCAPVISDNSRTVKMLGVLAEPFRSLRSEGNNIVLSQGRKHEFV